MQGSDARFDRYDVLAPLGAGGMGEVVKARALGPHGFEKVVAIKRIRSEWSAQESMATRFIREARIAARLQHANIVQVFDFGRHGDELFIVMEYVDGLSLDAILASLRAEGKRPTLAQTLQIGLDVGRALDGAHTLIGEDGAPGGWCIGT
ncbi:MAG: protein kinase [Sandaracinaceae bacterium]|nr:protein kinase [Sandaracinaceae bacterium]